jgi:hypothetical protein
MDFSDRRLWYGVVVVIVIILAIAYGAGWFGGWFGGTSAPPPVTTQ